MRILWVNNLVVSNRHTHGPSTPAFVQKHTETEKTPLPNVLEKDENRLKKPTDKIKYDLTHFHLFLFFQTTSIFQLLIFTSDIQKYTSKKPPKMPSKLRKSSKILFILLQTHQLPSAFNLDPEFKKLTGPQNSLFGYSLSNHLPTNSLLIGAPTDNQHGALFKCDYNFNENTQSRQSDQSCEKVMVDDTSPTFTGLTSNSKRNFLGGTVITDTETGRVLVCAHGYTEKSDYKVVFAKIRF